MTLLALCEELYKSLLPSAEHVHDADESPAAGECANCVVEEAYRNMSPFERAAYDWSFDVMTPFNIQTGLVTSFIQELELPPVTRALFLRAQSLIFESQKKIDNERVEEAVKRLRESLGPRN